MVLTPRKTAVKCDSHRRQGISLFADLKTWIDFKKLGIRFEIDRPCQKEKSRACGTGSKEQLKADMELFPYRLFSIAPLLSVVSKCALVDRQKSLPCVKGGGTACRDGGIVKKQKLR